MRLQTITALITSLVLLGTQPAFGQTPNELIEQATELANEAERLVEAGEYEAAARKYLEAAKKFAEAGMDAQAAAEYIKAGANFDNAAEALRRAGKLFDAASLFDEAADAYRKGSGAADDDDDSESSAAEAAARENARDCDGRAGQAYEKVDEDDKPAGIPCDPGGTMEFQIDLEWPAKRVASDIKSDTVTTDKDDWTEEDEEDFGEEYSEDHADELEEIELDEFNNLDSLIRDAIQYQAENKWNRPDYSICLFECSDPGEQCYITWRVVRTVNRVTRKFYKVSYSYVNEVDDGPNTVEVDFDLYVEQSATVYFEVTCDCIEIPADVYADSGWDPYWAGMDLTKPQMKVFFGKVPPPKGGFPIWIPIAVGAVATGTAIYFVTRDDDDPDPNPLVTMPDAVTVPCDGSGTVDVLNNDSGDGLRIISVPDISEASLTETSPGVISISDLNTTSNFNFQVTIGDEHGNEKVSPVNVTVTTPEIAATDDSYEIEYGSQLSANVLSNDIGPDLIVIDFNHSGEGTLIVQPDGELMFTPPDDFEGTVSGQYTIEGPCGLQSQATISIDVNGPDCEFEATITTTPASCGKGDGSAAVSVDPAGDYIYEWSDGQVGETVQLGTGDYSLTITSGDGNCTEVYNVEIEELPADFAGSFDVVPASCGQSDGSVEISVTPDDTYIYDWSTGDNTAQITDITAGTYSVTVTIDGTECSREFSVVVTEEPPDLEVMFSVTDANCNMSDGSAEATVTPDGNYEFNWSDGSTTNSIMDVPPGDYTLTVTLVGTNCASQFSVTVGNVPASFTGQIEFIEPDCGIENGTANVEVTPDGDYTYDWADGTTLPVVEDIGPGEYCVTVTDTSGCNIQVCNTIDAKPADYITNVQTEPGNCLGDGADIIITTTTPGAGPMRISANGPDGPQVVMAPPGVTSLAAFFKVIPGDWTIDVTDTGIDASCFEQANATVMDNSSIDATNDAYETVSNQEVTGNVLINDDGAQLKVVSNTSPSSGTLTLNEDGSFEYQPEADFTGEVTFEYTVMDACGNMATAMVTIDINSADCNFTASFSTTDANCGVDNGAIATTLDPPGNYSFAWSGGESTQDLQDIPAGQYSVTITDNDLSCDKEFNIVVDETDNTYFVNITTQPGDCTGGGEIEIEITTPGTGPVTLEIDGPDGLEIISLNPGTHLLSESFNIVPGNYILNAYDENAGPQCSEMTEVVVDDDTPVLFANNDNYTTPAAQSIDGNVLTNDDGLLIFVTDVFGVTGGTVTWNQNGEFTFTPDPGFIGDASFFYTVEDACGNVAEAEVIIIVEAVPCTFTVDLNVTDANCGLEDGVVQTIIDPPGNYTYLWSDGSSGSDLIGVPAGDYSLTVMDNDLGCDLTFNTTIGETPSDYISDLQVTQPSCPADGEITFTVTTPGTGAIEMEVIHPNGVLTTNIPEGPVVLSDYISITPGNYTITITEVAAGAACSNTFDVILDDPPPGPVIAIEAIIPPSDPTAEDGAIIIAVTTPTIPPYTIILNGAEIGSSADPVIPIEGLMAGFYSVQIRDANGCESNILDVEIPITGQGLQLGVSVLTLPPSRYQDLMKEQPSWTDNQVMRGPSLDISMPYTFAGHSLQADMRFAQLYVTSAGNTATTTFFSLDNRVPIAHLHPEEFNIDISAGIGADIYLGEGRQVSSSPHWTAMVNVERSIGKILKINAKFELTGWRGFHAPTLSIGVITDLRLPSSHP